MEKISSSTEIASSVITGVTSIVLQKGEQVSLGKSTITSIKTGIEVNNQLLSDLSQLINCVQTQSEKFPEIAEMIAIKDSQIKF
jgi:hypothetical protein